MGREPYDHMTEADQSSQNCHYSWIAKAKSRGIQTIVLGRSGHPIKGGHIGGWLSVCSFGVTERRRLADSPTARRACQFSAQTRRPISKSSVLQMTVSVRRARPSLKYCLIRED